MKEVILIMYGKTYLNVMVPSAVFVIFLMTCSGVPRGLGIVELDASNKLPQSSKLLFDICRN